MSWLAKWPRKAVAYGLTSALVLIAGKIIPSDKVTVVVGALVACFTGFIASHAATDIMAEKTRPAPGAGPP